jgi:hypothetical protein
MERLRLWIRGMAYAELVVGGIGRDVRMLRREKAGRRMMMMMMLMMRRDEMI